MYKYTEYTHLETQGGKCPLRNFMETTCQGEGFQPHFKNMSIMLKRKISHYFFPRRANPQQKKQIVQHMQA